MSRRRIYHEKTKLKSQCRVCLGFSNSMIDLNDHAFSNENLLNDEYKAMSVQEAIEKVTFNEVVLTEDGPSKICPMCLSYLKISIKFIQQFHNTQSYLNLKETDKNDNKPVSVEIIVGDNKFDLNDVVLVENNDDNNEKTNFDGFLNNLGKEISASYAVKKFETNKGKDGENEENCFVTVSLIDKNQIRKVKKLEFDVENDEIKCVVDEDEFEFEEEIHLTVVDDDEEIDSFSSPTQNDNIAENYVTKLIDEDHVTLKDLQNKYKLNCDVNSIDLNEFIVELDENNEKVFQAGDGGGKGKRIKKLTKSEKPKCEICDKTFPTKRSLRLHKWRSHSNKQFQCDICGHKTNTVSAYKHHKIKHIGKQFVCPICERTFYTKHILKVHMESHDNLRHHLCNVCGKSFNYPSALAYHMLLHTDVKKYQCTFCEKRFRMSNSLKRHLLTHTGERPYGCSFCDKSFRSSGELGVHRMTHTGERPYTCKFCDKGFTKGYNLQVHMLSHGGEFECEICNKNFADKRLLWMHYKMAHKEELLVSQQDS